MFNNLDPIYEKYLTIVNNQMQKDEQLENDEVWFKVIENERLISRPSIKSLQMLLQPSQMQNPKEELPEEIKNLLDDQNVMNVGANI